MARSRNGYTGAKGGMRSVSLSRRSFVRTGALLCGSLALSGCAPIAPPSPPTAAPASPASVAAALSPSPVAQAAPGQGGALTTVQAAYVALIATQLLFPMTLEGGYFQKHGIDFQLSYIQGSSDGTAGLASHSLDAYTGSGQAVIAAQTGGADILLLGSFVGQLISKIMATPDVPTMNDLKGKTAAVTKVGSGTDYFYWLDITQSLGWSSGDVNFISGGSNPGEIALLQQNQAQAMLTSSPGNLEAEAIGAHAVFDTTTVSLPVVDTAVIVQRDYLTSQRDTALNLLKACVEGAHRWSTDGEFAESVIQKYLKPSDPRFGQEAFATYTGHILPTPTVTRETMQSLVPQVAAQTPAAANVDVGNTLDMSLVQEMVDSGFIQQVWGA